jgi:deferrochelatase/peroxidase EfeB
MTGVSRRQVLSSAAAGVGGVAAGFGLAAASIGDSPTTGTSGAAAVATAVTFGFGPGLFDGIGRPQLRPASVAVLPRFGSEVLQPQWSDGDVLLQVCSDDPVTVAHSVRM